MGERCINEIVTAQSQYSHETSYEKAEQTPVNGFLALLCFRVVDLRTHCAPLKPLVLHVQT